MNKKILSLMTFAAISAASVSSVNAATSGVLSFTGTVEESTCELVGHTQTISFPEFNVAEVNGLAHNAQIHRMPVNFRVQNCPTNVSAAGLTFDYTPQSGTDKEYIDLPGASVRGVGMAIYAGSYIKNGDTRTVNIRNGSGSYTVYSRLNRMTRNGPEGTGATVVPGSYNGTFNVTMTVQ
ncbi:fimbrial protein [Pantoea sp.]|uniref:fimbrial protein n=1 Tax=Pantoea sp. TaxID=69393 RepID=UPI0031DDEABE